MFGKDVSESHPYNLANLYYQNKYVSERFRILAEDDSSHELHLFRPPQQEQNRRVTRFSLTPRQNLFFASITSLILRLPFLLLYLLLVIAISKNCNTP